MFQGIERVWGAGHTPPPGCGGLVSAVSPHAGHNASQEETVGGKGPGAGPLRTDFLGSYRRDRRMRQGTRCPWGLWGEPRP